MENTEPALVDVDGDSREEIRLLEYRDGPGMATRREVFRSGEGRIREAEWEGP